MTGDSMSGGLSGEVVDGTFDLARAGRLSELTEMIRAGVPVDVRNARSDTMLIVAAYARQAEVVGALIALGADLDRENRMGQTAISCAVFRNDGVILRALLEAGADPDRGFHSAAQIADQYQLAAMSSLLAEYATR